MMNPYLSWAILLVVAGGLGWYYNGPAPKVKNPVKPAVEKPEPAPATKKPKRKAAKKEPAPAKATEEKKQPPAETKLQEVDNVDEEIGNKELAERFAAVKNGTVPASGASKSQKKNKKSKKAPSSQLENGETPSTTGADADDDLSSAAESPVVNATVPTAGYVSDMLEEPAPGASVLRVTGSVESQPKKQKPQSFKQVETKKQRQQRQKNDARKEQVKVAEEERRKLLEKQLHTARESERRESAKAKPAVPTTNAWQAKNMTNGTPKAAPAPKAGLLDTFDETSSAKSSEPSGSNKWSQGLPSEEEQMRMLNASNEAPADEWKTVSTKTKKPKKKGGKTDESVSEASASETNPTPAAPVPAEPKVAVTPTYIPDILRSKQKGHPLDSDWAA